MIFIKNHAFFVQIENVLKETLLAQILYPLFTLTYIALLIWAIFLWFRGSSLSLALIFALLVGLLYDNAVIGYGNFIGEGDLLLDMNKMRFLLQAIMIPFVFLAAADQARRFGVALVGNRWMQVVLGLLAVVFIGVGLVNFASLALEAVHYSGTLLYTDVNAGVPLVSIVSVLITAVFGLLIWRQGDWPWLFAGATLMLMSRIIPITFSSYVIASSVDIVLLLAFLFTEKELKDRQDLANSKI